MSFFLVWLFLSVEKFATVLMFPASILFGPITLVPLLIISLGLGFAWMVTGGEYNEEDNRQVVGFIKKFYGTIFNKKTLLLIFTPTILMFFMGKMLPSQKDLAIILAAGGAYELLTTDPAKEIGGKAFEILKQELDIILLDNKNILKDGKEAAKSAIVEKIEGASL